MLNYFKQRSKNAIVKLKNNWQCHKNRRPLRNRKFSIISNNCTGGLISQHYGLPYRSPTCGLGIRGNDYIKFCKDIRHYLSQKLVFIPFETAKRRHEYVGFKPFPVAKLDDIEIYFTHYNSEEEAAMKWYRRAKRINWDNIIYKISHRECFTYEDIQEFASLDLPNKLIIGEKIMEKPHLLYPGLVPMLEMKLH